MNNMTSGMGTNMFFWIVLITLMCLLIIGACAWLVARLLNKQKALTTHTYRSHGMRMKSMNRAISHNSSHQKPMMKVASVMHIHKMSRGKTEVSRNGAVGTVEDLKIP